VDDPAFMAGWWKQRFAMVLSRPLDGDPVRLAILAPTADVSTGRSSGVECGVPSEPTSIMATDICVVMCTCPDENTARDLATRLVAERLAACINRVPGVTSTYRWQGEVHEDAEVLLIAKTSSQQFEGLRDRIVELHPYDVPEVIALPVGDGLPAYLDWVVAGGDD